MVDKVKSSYWENDVAKCTNQKNNNTALKRRRVAASPFNQRKVTS